VIDGEVDSPLDDEMAGEQMVAMTNPIFLAATSGG
jgi:hypothetical protein